MARRCHAHGERCFVYYCYTFLLILFVFCLFVFWLFVYYPVILSFFFFHLFCDNFPCSGMFRNVPEWMFRVLLTPQNKASMLPEIFLNSRNEVHLARVSIFVHLVADAYIYFSISFYSVLFYSLSFIDDQYFLLLFFHLFCDNLPCSGMFRNVPCSGFC